MEDVALAAILCINFDFTAFFLFSLFFLFFLRAANSKYASIVALPFYVNVIVMHYGKGRTPRPRAQQPVSPLSLRYLRRVSGIRGGVQFCTSKTAEHAEAQYVCSVVCPCRTGPVRTLTPNPCHCAFVVPSLFSLSLFLCHTHTHTHARATYLKG